MRLKTLATAAPEPNTTPLIDVLLVLLVLLILCLPRVTHQTTLNFPTGRAGAPSPITRLEIDFDGEVFWNGVHVPNSEQLDAFLKQVSLDPKQPLVQVIPDRHAAYGRVAQILAAAQRMHVTKLSVSSVADDRP